MNNIEDLQRAMWQLRRRIKTTEQNLEHRWDQLPEETFKAAAGAILPVFLKNQLATVAWKGLKEGLRLLYRFWRRK